MNRNVKYGIIGVALIGATSIAFSSWIKPIKSEVKALEEKEEEIVVEVAEERIDIDVTRYVCAISNGIVFSEAEEEVAEVDTSYLGYYTLTAYEWTGNPCANGNYPTCRYTAACNSLPLGTRIYIEGMGEYVIEDRGGMSDDVIDIYMRDVETCLQFGVQYADVYIVE